LCYRRRVRDYGPVGRSRASVRVWRLAPAFALSLPISRRVGVREIVDRFCPMGRVKHLTHGSVAEFLILHLLQSATRQPLYQMEHWAEQFGVERIYRAPASAFNDDRIGRALDAISESILDIETAVVTRALSSFAVDVRAIHWDLTHVTFSGAYEAIDPIAGGYGGGRLHEHQLKVSLHATSDGGLPIRHEVLAGGAHQAPFGPSMLADLQRRLQRTDLIVVSDRAGISYDNLVAYRRAGAHALGPLQATGAEQKTLAAVPIEAFTELSYRAPSAPEECYRGYETTLTIDRQKRSEPLEVRALFVHSTRLAIDDAATREKQLDKALTRLAQIKSHLNKRRYAKYDYAREQVYKAVPASLRETIRAALTGDDGGLDLTWSVDEAALAEAAKADGRYILIADVEDLSPDEIFALFKRQNVIEQRFRTFKSDLSVQPLWLHNEERIRALLLIFILALLVYTLIELCSERARLSTKYYHKMTARELLRAFEVVDLIELRIRGEPTRWELQITTEQTRLLQRLRLPSPMAHLITH
jgi:transposase